MKKIFTIIAIAMGLMLPMQAQIKQVNRSVTEQSVGVKSIKKAFATEFAQQEGNVYIYPGENYNDRNPIKIQNDKLYFHTVGNATYLSPDETIELDPIAGVYTATATSLFDGSLVEWSVEITRDETDTYKYWINPVCTIRGASSYSSVYVIADLANNTLTMPLGQTLYGSPESASYNMVIAGFDTSYNPVTSGTIVASITTVGTDVEISWAEGIGVGNLVDDSWWYQAVDNVVYTRVNFGVSSSEQIINLNQINSISTVTPSVELEDYHYQKMKHSKCWSLITNFNYDVLTYIIRNGEKKCWVQGWFNNLITYKAYDESNNLVVEDYIDIYNLVTGNTFEIPLIGFVENEDNTSADYGIDMFLPCDTAFKVAFSIADDAIVWANDTSVVYKGIDSYVDKSGKSHGIVIDYYNERPRLIGNAMVDVTDPYSAILRFSEDVQTIYDDGRDFVTYNVYRKNTDGKYVVESTGTDMFLSTQGDFATITIPQDSIVLKDGDIVTISYDNWNVVDDNFARATPFGTESYVDADGTPHGIYWMVKEVPIIISEPELTAFNGGKTVELTFNKEILRDKAMGAIEYMVYTVDMESGEAELFARGTDVTATASGTKLTVTLPIEFDSESYYVSTLSFAEGAVIDLYANKMAPVTSVFDTSTLEVIEGYWWFVEPAANTFFKEGSYNFVGWANDFGTVSCPVALSFISGNYDMGQIFNNPSFTGTHWELSSMLMETLFGENKNVEVESVRPIPGFSYEYKNSQDGLNYESIIIIDPQNGWLPCIGSLLDGFEQEFSVYLADLDDAGNLNPYWNFVLMDLNGNPEAPVDDLVGFYSMNTPVLIYNQNEHTGGQGKWVGIVQFDELYLTRSGVVEAASYTVYKEPRTLKGVKMNLGKPSLEQKVLLKK